MAGRPYSAFGKVLDKLARRRHVRGPYWIANHMKARLGAEKGVSGVAVGKWMYGESHPRSDNLESRRHARPPFQWGRWEYAFVAYGLGPGA